MKSKIIFIGIAILTVFILSNCARQDDFHALKVLYLEQTPPGIVPEIFAPGVVSSKDQEHSSLSFSPDGKELWWSLWRVPHELDKYPQVIKYIKFVDGEWSRPKTAPFSGKYRDGSPAFSPNGNRIYFYSRRPLEEDTEEMHDNDIWYVERSENGWSRPVNLGKPVNTPYVEAAPCLAANGNLYFTSNRNQYEDPIGNSDLFVSEFKNGAFCEPANISEAINTSSARESFSFIAPDESYIIFSRDSRRFDSEGHIIEGDRKLMISFRAKNSIWESPVEMGPDFYKVRFPSVSPDGKYLFFAKYSEETSEDFYWVDAKIIEDLKPNELK